MAVRAVYRNFSKGEQIWSMDKRGGDLCEVLRLLGGGGGGGGKNDTRGGMPLPP